MFFMLTIFIKSIHMYVFNVCLFSPLFKSVISQRFFFFTFSILIIRLNKYYSY